MYFDVYIYTFVAITTKKLELCHICEDTVWARMLYPEMKHKWFGHVTHKIDTRNQTPGDFIITDRPYI